MEEIRLTVHPFAMGTEKEAALKPLEEAAETYASWQDYHDEWRKPNSIYAALSEQSFADEIADCIQACANLAARYGIDLGAAMERCETRNRDRGRYPLSD